MFNDTKPKYAHDASYYEKLLASSSVLLLDSSSQTPATETPVELQVPVPVSPVSTLRVVGIISTLTAITIACSMNIGFITIGLPHIPTDLQLSNELLLWPAMVYSLATGCCLLLAGSIADVIGNRIVNLSGTFILGIVTLASGLAKTGIQLILFRAIQGVSVSMCLPTSISILISSIPSGRARNIGFSCLGLGTPFGFSIGLILGGIFEATVGGRICFYMSSGYTFFPFFITFTAFTVALISEFHINYSIIASCTPFMRPLIESLAIELMSNEIRIPDDTSYNGNIYRS